MFIRKVIYIALVILLTLNLILLGMIFHFHGSDLKVAFLDVGQGDAILLIQGENQILIDGGKSEESLLEGLGKAMPFWDKKIEVVLATHPDQDHIGGLSELPQIFEIGSLISTNAQSESNVFKIFKNNYSQKDIQKIEGKYGVKIKLGDSEFDVLYPFKSLEEKVYKDTNATSLVGKLTFNRDKFLLSGDMAKEQEEELLKNNIDVDSQYLKVAHHGSKYATSQDFLKKVNPLWGIISVGKNNRYGHPASEILERLKEDDIEVLRTDEMGDIVFVCSEKTGTCQREEL